VGQSYFGNNQGGRIAGLQAILRSMEFSEKTARLWEVVGE
jgi:hypothetical protein